MWQRWVGGLFFIGSYSPLWVILGVRQWDHTRLAAVVLLAVGFIAGAGMWAVISLTRRSIASTPIRLTGVSARESDAVAYLITYVLPLVDAPFDDLAKALPLALLLSVTGFIYV